MKAINEAKKTEQIDYRYAITLLYANDIGEHITVQSMFPADLQVYLKEKTVVEIGGLFFFGKEIPCRSLKDLERFCND